MHSNEEKDRNFHPTIVVKHHQMKKSANAKTGPKETIRSISSRGNERSERNSVQDTIDEHNKQVRYVAVVPRNNWKRVMNGWQSLQYSKQSMDATIHPALLRANINH